jgi:hypothetical protein
VAYRYLVEETQAARVIGVKLASPDVLRVNKNGHQNAVSIPEANKWCFLSMALLLGGLAWLAFGCGWWAALAGLLTAYGSSTIAQVLFLPKKDSLHFTMCIFNSMGRRYADYERDGDKQRAEAMRYLLDRFESEYGPAMVKGDQKPTEKIINKSDADYIFSLDRAGWESYAERMVHPGGWKIQLGRHDTGTSVMAFDAATGMGLSTQPLFSDSTNPPVMLVVGSYYPVGTLQTFTDKRKAALEKDAHAQADLGKGYSLRVRYFSEPPVDGIELQVTRADPAT